MKKTIWIILLCMLVLALTSCGKQEGTVVLQINDSGVEMQTLLPDIDMTIASYRIIGVGPLGKSFTVADYTSTSCTINSLAFGDWTVTVYALNTSGIVIGEGSATVTVHVGQTTPALVEVRPLTGVGTLNVTANWNVADLENPSVVSELVSPITTTSLTFTQGVGTASYANSALSTGYYSLIVKLLDSGILTMGAVEVVRIVKGGTTTGDFNFYNLNQPGGSIIIGITPAMDDPIDVTIAGQAAQLAVGASMTVTASVPAEIGNVSYVWYINGQSREIGSTYTISGLEPGVYRLDVTAFTVDGKRAGSATHTFTVTETMATPATWLKTYGEYNTEQSGAITAASDGGYVIAGGSNSFNQNSNYLCPVLFKVDGNGNQVWAREYESDLDEGIFRSVAQAADGGFYAAGYLGYDLYEQALLVKVNSLGVTEWAITCGDSHRDMFTSVAPTLDGGCYVAGITSSDNSDQYDLIVAKFDSAGFIDLSSSILIRTESGAMPYSIQATADGGACLVGEVTLWDHIFGFICKLSNTGICDWYDIISRVGPELTSFRGVEENGAGYLISGFTAGSMTEYEDLYLVQYSHSGSVIWSKGCGGSSEEKVLAMEQDLYGNYVFVGTGYKDATQAIDAFVIKMDESGNILSQIGIGGTGNDMFNGVTIGTGDEIVAVGETWSFAAEARDYLVAKGDSTGVVETSPHCYPLYWGIVDVTWGSAYSALTEESMTLPVQFATFPETTPVIPFNDVTF